MFRLTPLALAATLALALPGAAAAEEAPAETGLVAAVGPQVSLGAIVVTAQKRLEKLQEVPVAISVIGRDELANAEELKTANDITQLVPNASAHATDGRTRPRWFLRGIGTNETAATTVSPIGIYYDDVYLNNVYIQGFPLFDTERVEVLRGPQGTLWGKNTTGGAIHYLSRRPTFTDSGWAKLTLGSFNERVVQGALGGTVVADRVAARVSFYNETRDGWVKNTATGNDDGALSDRALRLQALWVVNDETEVLVSGRTRQLSGDKSPSFYVLDPNQTVRNPAYAGPLKGRDEIAQAGQFGENFDADGATVRAQWERGGWTVTSITAHDTGRRVLYTGSPIALDVSRSRALADSRQTTQELRVATPTSGSVDGIAGVYYFRESLFSDSAARRDAVAGGSSTNPANASPKSFDITDYTQGTSSKAAFAAGTWRIGGGFALAGGLRRSVERKVFDLAYAAAPSTATFTGISQWWLPAGVSTLGAAQLSHDGATWTETTYDVTPQWRINDDLYAYARYAHGFRAGGFVVSTTNTITQLEPETLNATELGLKTQWLGGRLVFNTAVFNYDYRDIIVGVLLPVPNSNPPTTQQVQENAAKGYARGAEFELAWQFDRHTRLGSSLGLLKTRYTDYQSSASGQTINATGNRFTRAPEVTFGLDGELGFDLPGGGVAGVGGDASWRSKQYFNAVDQSTPTLSQKSYTLLNLRAFWRLAGGRTELGAFVRNAGDTVYSGLATNTTTGVTRQVYGLPRSVGVTAQLRF